MDNAILSQLEQEIIKILTGEIKTIIETTRKNMIVVGEKSDGDSATVADIKIGEIFDNELPKLLPNSIVIQEESFNEDVYKQFSSTEYVWVVDPIDGTKAFRDKENYEWCVGVCLLQNLNPILSIVYMPEKWLGEPMLISANSYRNTILNYGKPLNFEKNNNNFYICHIHRDTERNLIENKIAELFPDNETIRAFVGHSTLAQFFEVAINTNKVFSRRGANIWDIIQSAYLIQKNGGEVYYEDGTNIFPLNINKLQFKDNHLIMPFTIASSLSNKQIIMNKLKNL